MIPRKIYTPYDKMMLVEHLQRLQGNDRRLRFGAMIPDDAIEKYVDDCWGGDNIWYGVVQDNDLIAVVHVAFESNSKAELGLSVDPAWRGLKLGQALFERAVMSLRARNVSDVFMHCLSENAVIKHIAYKNKMVMRTEYGETDADLHLQPSTALDPITNVVVEQLAIYDSAVRNAGYIWRKLYADA